MNLPRAKFTVGYATPSRLAKRREILSLYDYTRGTLYETWSRNVMRHVDMGVYRWRLSVATAIQHEKASLRRAQQRSPRATIHSKRPIVPLSAYRVRSTNSFRPSSCTIISRLGYPEFRGSVIRTQSPNPRSITRSRHCTIASNLERSLGVSGYSGRAQHCIKDCEDSVVADTHSTQRSSSYLHFLPCPLHLSFPLAWTP